MYSNVIDDAVINKHDTIYTNGMFNVIEINKLVNFNDSNYFTKKIEHTNTITNNTAKPRTKILRFWSLSQEDLIYCAWTFGKSTRVK